MTKHVHIIFLLLLCFIGANGQLNDRLEKSIFVDDVSYEHQKKSLTENLEKYFFENLNQTLVFTERGMNLGFSKNDSAFAGKMIMYHGRANYFAGNYDKAAAEFYRAISILKAMNDKPNLASCHNDLAKLYRKIRNLDLAMDNYDISLKLFSQVKDSAGICMVLNESGVVYEYQKDYKKAIEKYNASKTIAEKLNDSLAVSYSLSFIAGVYTLQGKFNEAEQLLLEAFEIRKALNIQLPTALLLADLGNNALMKGDYAKAKNYLVQSNTIAFALNYDQLMAENYEKLAEVAQQQGDFKMALNFFKKGVAVRDSIYTLEKTKQIDELSTQYKTQKKEHQIRFLSEEIKRKNILLFSAIIVFLLSALLVWSFIHRRKLKTQAKMNLEIMKHRQQVTTAVIEASEKERQRIAQELHDGVGQMLSATKMNLSAFENRVEIDDANEKKSLIQIVKLVDDSCKEVRAVSHNMMASSLSKNTLEKALRSLIEPLQEKSLIIHLFTEGVNKKMDFNVEIMLYRIVQECLNNIIKHSKATVVDITLIKDDKEISLTVEDNGVGFVQKNRQSDGVGLQSIKARVAYLEGTIEIESASNAGTVIAIHAPLKSNIN